MRRTLLSITLVGMVVLFVVMIVFFGNALAGTQVFSPPTPTPVPTPTPTPTPSPTPTPEPTPTPQATLAPTPTRVVNADAAYIMDVDTGKVLLDVNGGQQHHIASTTKIMTAVLALENLDPDQRITITQAPLDELPPTASVAQLQVNDKIRVRNLLYGLMLPSGSDVALVLAHAISGTTANFVALMNTKAQALGLVNTHFSNPHGVIETDHYSSAIDMTKLARFAMSYPLFAQVVSQQYFELPASDHNHRYTWPNTNRLLGTYEGANGVKTGSSDAAGFCIVFSVVRNGHHLMGAELGAASFEALYPDVSRLLDQSFAKE